MQGRGGLCQLLPPCQVTEGFGDQECWATRHLDLCSVPPGQPVLLGLTHSSWSARILSLCRWKRDPGTSPWLTREGSGWPLGERNVSRECNRKQPPPQTASWSPGSQLLACYPVQALPPSLLGLGKTCSPSSLPPGSPYLVLSTTCLTPPQPPWRAPQRELRQAVWLE